MTDGVVINFGTTPGRRNKISQEGKFLFFNRDTKAWQEVNLKTLLKRLIPKLWQNNFIESDLAIPMLFYYIEKVNDIDNAPLIFEIK